MVGSKFEVPSQEVEAKVADENDNGQELTAGHTMASFCFCEDAASIGNDTFSSLTVHLGEDGPNTGVTGICVEGEGLGVVREGKDGGGDE